MLDEILGVVNVVPDPRIPPPLDAAYQFNVPALALAPKLTVPLPHRLPGVVKVTVGVLVMVKFIVKMLSQPKAFVNVSE